jgi:hypothetical protein
MLQLARDPALVERLGHQARGFAERLSWGLAADDTERWMQGMIGSIRTATWRAQ